MASPEVLEFDTLLAPIGEEHPTGIELRDEPEASQSFFQLKEAREAARTAERQLMHWYGEGERPEAPNWRPVSELAQRILAEKSKDLWVSAWFLEALVRLHGFVGLRDGLRLIRELSERYWAEIHPAPDEDGYAHTTSQLIGVFDGALAGPIDAIPITPTLSSQRALSSADFKDAVVLERMDVDARAKRIDQGAATRDMFNRAIHADHADHYRQLLADIDGAMDEFVRLAEELERRCGSDDGGHSAAPPTSSVREAITSVRDLVRSLTRDLLALPAEEVTADGSAGEPAGATSAATGATGPIRSREDAFRALLLVADFFRRTEPHSPVSYSLEQAVRWGRMPFPQLMSELISDDGARREMLRRVGVAEEKGNQD